MYKKKISFFQILRNEGGDGLKKKSQQPNAHKVRTAPCAPQQRPTTLIRVQQVNDLNRRMTRIRIMPLLPTMPPGEILNEFLKRKAHLLGNFYLKLTIEKVILILFVFSYLELPIRKTLLVGSLRNE